MENIVKIKNQDIEILVTEDSHSQGEYLKRILEKFKNNITVTHDGEEPLTSIKKKKPDILIRDVMMPDLDDYKLC